MIFGWLPIRHTDEVTVDWITQCKAHIQSEAFKVGIDLAFEEIGYSTKYGFEIDGMPWDQWLEAMTLA